MRVGSKRKLRRIQEVLDSQKPRLSLAEIARRRKVSYQLVWRTANGLANNRKLLLFFLDLGVSPDDLDLPLDMVRPSAIAEKLGA